MTDVVPELLKKIQESFVKNLKKNNKLKDITNKIKLGKATYADAEEYALTVGTALAESFKQNLNGNVLPDGRMYYNIAERILNSTLKENHKIISDVTSKIQTELNKQAKLGIKAIRPKINQDRIDGIINRVSSEAAYNDVSWLLDEPVVTFSESIVDEFIEENASFHYKSGLSPKIVRIPEAGACKWCRAVAGTYRYPDVPKDVFRRHDFCRCIVDYTPGDGKWQNVHNKKWKKDKLDIEEKALRSKGGDFDVDWTVIKSKEYTNRFNQLSDNDKANQLAAKRARNMLVNRDGKETEEIYAISLTTGKDVSKIIDQHYIRGVKRTQKFMDDIKRAESKGEKILLLHNHPGDSIPSLADLNELKSHENVVGITIGHKGSIYYYTKPNNEIRQMDLNIALLKKSRYNYEMRMEEAMKYLAKEFEFDFKIL